MSGATFLQEMLGKHDLLGSRKGLRSMPERRLTLDPDTILVLVLEHERALGDDRLQGLLDWSSADLERMARFKHQGAKTSWCLSRRLLRDSLFYLAGVEDADQRLAYGEQGKPYIEDCRIRFNWSHAEGCIALGLTVGREVGVDIEGAARQRGDYLDVARAYFREEEAMWIGTEPGDGSWTRFLSLFVQKEAWLKATGRGLSMPLAVAPAVLSLPPVQGSGRLLTQVGREGRYFLSVDGSVGMRGIPNPRLIVERIESPMGNFMNLWYPAL
jgi:4'-phosphopantetheinyl transferase